MSTDTGYKEPLLISIITPCLNRVDFVATAITSVLEQDYSNVEHIVVDGGSTDGTLEILNHFSKLKVISERDHGIYDAINKGIHLAQGQVIGLLNSDDFYERGIFSSIVTQFIRYPEVKAMVGGADVRKKADLGDWEVIKAYSPITPDLLLQRVTVGVPTINAWFFRKTIFDELGLFNTQYKIAADRDFLLRFSLMGLKFAPVHQLMYHYQQHPGSITMDGIRDSEDDSVYETRQLVQKYLSEPGITPQIRRYLLTWQSEILVGQVIGAIRLHKPKQAMEYARYGWRQDRSWPVSFLRKLSNAFSERLR